MMLMMVDDGAVNDGYQRVIPTIKIKHVHDDYLFDGS